MSAVTVIRDSLVDRDVFLGQVGSSLFRVLLRAGAEAACHHSAQYDRQYCLCSKFQFGYPLLFLFYTEMISLVS